MRTLERIQEIAAELAALDATRAALVAERDGLIVYANEVERRTWVELQAAARLTPRGIQLAKQRAAATQPGNRSATTREK